MDTIPVDDIEGVYSNSSSEVRRLVSALLSSDGGKRGQSDTLLCSCFFRLDEFGDGVAGDSITYQFGNDATVIRSTLFRMIKLVTERFGLDWFVETTSRSFFEVIHPSKRQYVWDRVVARIPELNDEFDENAGSDSQG